MVTRRSPRPRVGWWDAIVGPGAGPVENAGTVTLGVAGTVLAPRLARGPSRPGPGARLVLRVLAADLWGGAWCNNTPAAARWYGQEPRARHHLAFAAAHVHPFVVARLDAQPRWDRALAQYAYLLAATAVLGQVGRPAQRVLALLTTAGGLALDRWWGTTDAAPWFGTVYYVKLLAGHAGGAALLHPDPLAAPKTRGGRPRRRRP
ncbi:hypothetical protein [Actinomycetospora cinnamomea]|uniref:Uncharacterized protein n=1 Tax=Actinomycetospora cinnamomea TaxID=663609 RepID=A0A2U1FB38_9PSEU|nr:hypothetical protein [Actinomycetospora cinnamomea]PVZ09349.1 hypothetical protein C8D89_1064 [Actinomycetospora cinnamomea]